MDLIIDSGFMCNGRKISGNDISALAPTKIIYTGSDKKEEERIKKWASRCKASFSTRAKSKPEIPKTTKIEKSEPKIEPVKSDEDLNESDS